MSQGFGLRSTVATALMAALICVTSFIAIPLPIPLTLQTFGIFFALFTLGGRRGALATLLYIVMGAVGMPVFSGFTGGVARLFDATGGYIFGFILSALIFWLITAVLPNRSYAKIIAAAAALLLLYLTGTLWYALVYLGGAKDIPYVFSVCVLPFIIPDILKIFLAYLICQRLNKIIKI